jgi:hypothetical protein
MGQMNELLILIGKLYQVIHENGDHEALLAKVEREYLKLANALSFDPLKEDEMTKSFDAYYEKQLLSLESQMKTATLPSVAAPKQSKRISSEVSAFWKEVGFHFIRQTKYRQNGRAEFEFAFSLDYGSAFSTERVTGKMKKEQTIARLIEEGYMLDKDHKHLLDCDANKERVLSLIQTRFPSARVCQWGNRMSRSGHILDGVTILVDHPTEIFREVSAHG